MFGDIFTVNASSSHTRNYDNNNKKVLGKFKDEMNGIIIPDASTNT